MWLLDSFTLELCDFGARNIPHYAILSHTWGAEEVSFQDIQGSPPDSLQGYEKIRRSCSVARVQGYSHVWIDTCCIDKKSSAELSEAINSMFEWYAKSEVCYVYLTDVSKETDTIAKLHASRWFRRGWTLQELLAPENIEFYDREWRLIGNKLSLLAELSAASGIHHRFLREGRSISEASVATRMSWYGNRQTTRPEDEAYCLMGIFDVNMPLLYGEGKKAFTRLQQEIARGLDDEALFAWHTDLPQSGVFAPSPSSFLRSGDILPIATKDLGKETSKEAFTISNRGLRLDALHIRSLPFTSLDGHLNLPVEDKSSRYYLLPLNCGRDGKVDRPYAIILKRVSKDQYVRYLPSEIMVFEKYFPQSESIQGRDDIEIPPSILSRFKGFPKMLTKPKDPKAPPGEVVEQPHPMIYIRDPPKTLKDKGFRYWDEARLPVAVLSPVQSIWDNVVLLDSYLSPCTFLQPMDYTGRPWSIRFLAWSGFAVLKFRGPVASFYVVAANVHTEDGTRDILLDRIHSLNWGTRLEDVVEACYNLDGLLSPVPKAQSTRRVRTWEGIDVSVARRPTGVAYDDYFLSIEGGNEPLVI